MKMKPNLPGIRRPTEAFGLTVRENNLNDPRIPTTVLWPMGPLDVGSMGLESPDRGAAQLHRGPRERNPGVGEEGVRSAVMVLNGGRTGRTRGAR